MQPEHVPLSGTSFTARERIDFLLDDDWHLLSDEPALCCGEGKVHGRRVLAVAMSGGNPCLSVRATEDFADLAERSAGEGMPLFLILDAHEIPNDRRALAATLRLIQALASARRRAVAAVAALGSVVGALSVVAHTADFRLAGPRGGIALAGSDLVEATVGHATRGDPRQGFDRLCESDGQALLALRRIFSMLPQHDGLRWHQLDPDGREAPALARIVGTHPDLPFDGRRLVSNVVDDRDWIELAADRGMALVCGLARLGGQSVAILASDSTIMSGALDTASLIKALRHIDRAVRLGLPLVLMLDTPGILPENGAEEALARLAAALADNPVPVVTLAPRRVIGAATVLLGAPAPTRRIIHWPTAQIGLTRASASAPDDGSVVPPAATRQALITALRDASRACP